MIIEVIQRSAKEQEECEYRNAVVIKLDGEKMFSVHDGETEDNNLGRNFNDVYNIPTLLVAAYNAGVRGDDIELINTDSDEI